MCIEPPVAPAPPIIESIAKPQTLSETSKMVEEAIEIKDESDQL